ncbi:hypothetical protein QJS10_CPA06g01852 [Acorus calamus]|uniref:Uncharacterized protein n=1 Tax=Acorus calamus TaxID=4465 RepID=A0AAV9EKQ5_ACOCL|nr:hypothetical protein QJS10_CPA06g01852 [Acorus calamus]
MEVFFWFPLILSLEHVHAFGCEDTLVGAIQNQILNDFTGVENLFQCKRLVD